MYDAATGTAYFTSKVADGPDLQHPHWYMHAIDITTGTERAGFPTTIAGAPSNDPSNPFNPFTAMQRPGLLLMNGVVYAGFASHCDFGPYVGYIVGVNAAAGGVKTMWSTEAGSSNALAGIWQSGGGLVSDGDGRIIVATGNGVSPAPGPGTHAARDARGVGDPAAGRRRRHAVGGGLLQPDRQHQPRPRRHRPRVRWPDGDPRRLRHGRPPAPARRGRQGRPGLPARP